MTKSHHSYGTVPGGCWLDSTRTPQVAQGRCDLPWILMDDLRFTYETLGKSLGFSTATVFDDLWWFTLIYLWIVVTYQFATLNNQSLMSFHLNSVSTCFQKTMECHPSWEAFEFPGRNSVGDVAGTARRLGMIASQWNPHVWLVKSSCWLAGGHGLWLRTARTAAICTLFCLAP